VTLDIAMRVKYLVALPIIMALLQVTTYADEGQDPNNTGNYQPHHRADDPGILPYSHEYLKSEMERCLSIDRFSRELCGCVIATSNKMSENDPILYIFIEYSKHAGNFKDIYDGLLDGNTYNDHSFKNREEKREFIEGKARIFVRRIKADCGTIK
jgi:hypothetical protein